MTHRGQEKALCAVCLEGCLHGHFLLPHSFIDISNIDCTLDDVDQFAVNVDDGFGSHQEIKMIDTGFA